MQKAKSTILVTGGAGYIGSVVVLQLLQKGYNVRVVDALMFGGESLLSVLDNPHFSLLVGDIRKKAVVEKAVEGVDRIIHLASLVGPGCNEDASLTKEINTDATKLLLAVAKKKHVDRFIFASSASNYGVSQADEEATEETVLKPLSLYSETKVAAEEYIMKESKPVCSTIVRFAMIFGLSPKIRFNLMVNEFAREAAMGNPLSIRNPKAWRPFLHVRDASDALVTILEAEKKLVTQEVFNITSENIQKKTLAKLAKKLDPKISIKIEETGKDDLRDYKVSGKKIMQILGWKPTYSIQDGLTEIFSAIQQGIFIDPYEGKWNDWLRKDVL